NPSFRDFDGVPNLVRAPIVFDSVIRQFEPIESVGEFEVLRRRQADVPVRVEYWRSKLGSTLDLRALPAHSSLLAAPVCGSSGSDCVDALEVTLKGRQTAGAVSVPVRVGSSSFEVKLS